MKQAVAKAGFTLVEMLVVLAIMAATLAVSLPYVRGSGDAQILAATAQNVAVRLRETQSSAMFNNATKALSFDLTHNLIIDPLFVLPQGVSLKITTAQNEMISDFASIRFFADGGSSGGKITMSKGGETQELAINWLTGSVVVTKVSKQ
jgi:general secretion pathway protein H